MLFCAWRYLSVSCWLWMTTKPHLLVAAIWCLWGHRSLREVSPNMELTSKRAQWHSRGQRYRTRTSLPLGGHPRWNKASFYQCQFYWSLTFPVVKSFKSCNDIQKLLFWHVTVCSLDLKNELLAVSSRKTQRENVFKGLSSSLSSRWDQTWKLQGRPEVECSLLFHRVSSDM